MHLSVSPFPILTVHILTKLIIRAALWGKYCPYLLLRNQTGSVVCPRSPSNKVEESNFN